MLSENQTYRARLQDRRNEILKVVESLPPEALDWKPLPEDTSSIAVLATHALGAERQWLHAVVGQKQIERDRGAEFLARGSDLGDLKARYAATAQETEQILSALTPEEMDELRTNGRYTESVRWCIVHVIEHYSEHLAQIWLTKQIWETEKLRVQDANPKSRSRYMSEEKHEEEPRDDADLAQELRELGRQLKEAIRVALEHPQTKELERQVAQAVNQLTSQVERALQSAHADEHVKQAETQVKQTAQALKEGRAGEDIQRGLAKGVRAVNEQIARAIAQAEKTKPQPEPEQEQEQKEQGQDQGPQA